MKKLYSIIMSLSILMMALSCDDSEFETTEDNLGRYVAFTESSVSFQESSVTTTADGLSAVAGNTQSITIIRSSSDLSGALTVNMNVSVVFTSDTEFADAGDDASSTVVFSEDLSSITIPNGEASKTITITALNDNFSAGDKLITLSMTSVSESSYSLGQQQTRNVIDVTVIDDDCPIDLAGEFVGSYTLSEEFTAGTNEGRSFGFNNVTDLTADPESLAGTGAFLTANEDETAAGDDFWLPNTPIEFITCAGTVSFNENPLLLGFNVNDEQATFNLLSSSYSLGSITLVGNLGNVAGINFGEYTIELEKK